MLYVDKERKKDFKYERSVLAEAFPFTFTKTGVVENPIPIMVEYTNPPKPVAVYYQGNTEMQAGYRKVANAFNKISGKGKFIDQDGVTKEWIYATSAPVVKSGEKVFTRSSFDIAEGMALDPIQDFEKIVALYFYSPSFSNGEYAKKNGRGEGAMWKFVKQGEKAAKRIEQETFRAKVYNLLLDPSGRLTDEQLKEVFALINFVGTGVLEDDRLAIYDTCLQRPEFAERFFKNVKPVVEASKSVKVTLGVQDLVKKAKKEKVLVLEGEKDLQYWYIKNANGVTIKEVCQALGTNQQEKDANLVEYLKSVDEDVETLQELLRD